MTPFPELLDTKRGVVLVVRVQPGARRSRVVGRHGDACKVAVAAPPVDGKANAALEKALATAFGLPRAHVAVVGGLTSRTKRVALGDLSLAEARVRLQRAYDS